MGFSFCFERRREEMNKELRPVISLMVVRGATKEEIDQMNLYFDKYNLNDVYKAIQRITSKRRRDEKDI